MVAITRTGAAHEIARQGRLASAIADGQTRIATGARMARASDAPANWAATRRIDRALDQAAAWDFAIGTGLGRAAQAESALSAINEQITRARELMVLASGPGGLGAGAPAIVAELSAIRDGIAQSLAQTDSDGMPVFDAGSALHVPAGSGLALAAVPQAADVSGVVTTGVVTTGGATTGGVQSIDAILAGAITAVRAGGPALSSASDALAAAGDHISLELGKQGLRAAALQAAQTTIATLRIDWQERRSVLADSDISADIIRVQQQMTALDATRSTFARLSQRSLFDLIG